MKTGCRFLTVMAASLLLGTIGTPDVRGSDVLYVGDAGDNTIKRFDARSSTFLGSSDGPGISGLAGPRGIIRRGSELLVVNQNVDLDIPGEVLRFDRATGAFLGRLVSALDAGAPFAPMGLVLGDQNDLFVGNLQPRDSVSPGRVNRYHAGTGAFLGSLTVKGNEHHPRGVVFGPDGDLYVAARDLKKGPGGGPSLGGTVFRLSKQNGKAEVFIDDKGGFGQLNRPDGLAFGPDGSLYVTSFRADVGDVDAIRIYNSNGQFVDKIDLFDPATEPRAFSQAIVFGPGGKLFVSILDKVALGNNLGELRRYDVPTKTYVVFAPNVTQGGVLLQPYYLTFGHTDPSTLSYEE